MRLNDFTQFFDNPKVSVFNRSQNKDLPLRIGKFIPTRWDLLNFGNSNKTYSGHKMRLSPMIAPNFSNMKLEEHAAVVPLRVIMEDYENTMNYATNLDGSSLPHFTAQEYHNILKAFLRTGHSLTGSLFDYFGYPIYSDLFKIVVNESSYFFYTFTEFDMYLMATSLPSNISAEDYYYYVIDNKEMSFYGNITYRDTEVSLANITGYRKSPFLPFLHWLFAKVYPVQGEHDFYTFIRDSSSYSNSLEYVATAIGSTVSALTEQYLNYVFGAFLGLWIDAVNFPNNVNYTTLPFRAYLRVYMDWLTNGNFENRDLLLDTIYRFERVMTFSADNVNNGDVSFFSGSELLYPVNRLWDYDYFTSLLPTAKADNAIEIPANSTVLDLAKLTAIQKLVLRLSYSSRYRDVVWNIFKIKPSDARLQQSSIISERIHNVGIGETVQTSETTVSSVLGSFAGRGYSSGNNKGYHIFCEEPCVVFDFVSLTAVPSYRDALHPLIHVDDIMDMPIPDMDVLGNTPVYSDIVSGNVLDSDTVLGYGRQYQEWLYNFNTVHGEFRTSLDYWQLTRSFDNTPVLNDDFLRMNDKEDFDAIFSVVDAPHAQLSIYYRSFVTRHVHRSVRIIV